MLTGHRLSASNRYSAVEPADLTESNGEGHPQCPPPTVPRELKASAGHLFAVLSGRLHQEGRPPKKEASLLLRRSPGSDRPDWGHLARTGKLSGVRGLGARLWKTGAVQQLLWQKLVFGADEWGEAGRLSPCGPVDSLWSSGFLVVQWTASDFAKSSFARRKSLQDGLPGAGKRVEESEIPPF